MRTYGNPAPAVTAESPLRLPQVPEDCRTNYHMFYILLPDAPTRNTLLAHLKDQGIHAVFHYVPLHASPMGRQFGYQEGDLPVTEDLAARLVRLPMYYEITEEDQTAVVQTVAEFCSKRRVTATEVAIYASGTD